MKTSHTNQELNNEEIPDFMREIADIETFHQEHDNEEIPLWLQSSTPNEDKMATKPKKSKKRPPKIH
jgi:hypothetical protein